MNKKLKFILINLGLISCILLNLAASNKKSFTSYNGFENIKIIPKFYHKMQVLSLKYPKNEEIHFGIALIYEYWPPLGLHRAYKSQPIHIFF